MPFWVRKGPTKAPGTLLSVTNTPDVATRLAAHVDDDFCYLTTRGRVTGAPHEIEIWFALDPWTPTTLFLHVRRR